MANKEATRVSAHVDRVLEAPTAATGAGALGSAVVLLELFGVVVGLVAGAAGLGVAAAAGASQQATAVDPVTEAPLFCLFVVSKPQSNASQVVSLTHIGAHPVWGTTKIPAIHLRTLVPEYPVALHVNVQSAPLAVSVDAQSLVYCRLYQDSPPSGNLSVHASGVHVGTTVAA
jgi:hypothetical protein